MVCILCSRTALYTAAGVGFCGAHKKEAVDATKKEKRVIMSRMAVEDHLAPHARRSQSAIQPWNGYKFEEGE